MSAVTSSMSHNRQYSNQKTSLSAAVFECPFEEVVDMIAVLEYPRS